MRIAVKYGLIIAAGVAIWVMTDHFLLHISRPGSKASFLTPLFFSFLQLVVLFTGIRARRQENQDKLPLGQGIWSGLAISLAYGVFVCIFFLALYLILGSKLLENERAASGNNQPEKYVLLWAFAGFFFTALVGGLIFSTVISFALRTRPEYTPPSRAGRPGRRR
jgi:hypothetical protein